MAGPGAARRGCWCSRRPPYGAFGGAIARYLSVTDSWTAIFWRSLCAGLFLLGFMLWREGRGGTAKLFRAMGWAGIWVGVCFATASTCFVVALGYTTVANILLMQAGAPLFAALAGAQCCFASASGCPPGWPLLAVIAGVGIMVSIRGGRPGVTGR
jgi:drug/metabolite transporter (DMT)-like permease